MQERTALSGMDLKAYLGRLKQNPKYTEEILKLIEDDLRFGLTKEETEEYSSGRYDYRQMCVYSKCLRNGYSSEEKAAILKEGLSGEQMAVALEFYEKGVPMDTITGVLSSAENTAYTMKRLFSQVLCKAREAEPVSGQDAQIQSNLLSQLSEKDKMLEKQQNELNEARVQIAKLHGEMEAVRKERKALEEQVKNAVREEPDAAAEPKGAEKEKKPETKAESSAPGMPESALYAGIEYHAAVTAVVALLKQANTDSSRMAEVIGVSEAQLRFVTNTSSGMGLMKCGNVVIPFDNTIEKGTDLYNLYNTNIHEIIQMQKMAEKSRKAVDNAVGA